MAVPVRGAEARRPLCGRVLVTAVGPYVRTAWEVGSAAMNGARRRPYAPNSTAWAIRRAPSGVRGASVAAPIRGVLSAEANTLAAACSAPDGTLVAA